MLNVREIEDTYQSQELEPFAAEKIFDDIQSQHKLRDQMSKRYRWFWFRVPD